MSGWLWAVPGIGLAIAVYFGASRLLGKKVGLLAGLAVVGLAVLKVITAGAYKRGAQANEQRQLDENERVGNRLDEAARIERERQKKEKLIDENDPNLRRDD